MKKTLILLTLAVLAVNLGAQNPKYTFTEASELNLSGKILEDTPNPYHRVDTTFYKGFTARENHLVRMSSGMQIDLGESVTLEEIYVLCYDKDDRYYHYDVYTSEDGESFKLLIEKRDDASEKAVGGNCWRFQNGERARYVRVVGVLCSIPNNPNFHVKELQIYAASDN